ncbi:dihydroorotate dehydrogenase electron transfer subunit [Desmospora sp. 8437]|nr:dihydroorotate dehydrogenase electron transfer subunit [Desmospora sp. 8437]
MDQTHLRLTKLNEGVNPVFPVGTGFFDAFKPASKQKSHAGGEGVGPSQEKRTEEKNCRKLEKIDG